MKPIGGRTDGARPGCVPCGVGVSVVPEEFGTGTSWTLSCGDVGTGTEGLGIDLASPVSVPRAQVLPSRSIEPSPTQRHVRLSPRCTNRQYSIQCQCQCQPAIRVHRGSSSFMVVLSVLGKSDDIGHRRAFRQNRFPTELRRRDGNTESHCFALSKISNPTRRIA